VGAAAYPFSLEPVAVPRVETGHRRIVTALPVPESLPILRDLIAYEPASMALEQLPVVWDRAEGATISDQWGNRWIDFSSGIFVANVGHGHPDVIRAIEAQLGRPLLHNYYFPSAGRAALVKKLVQACGPPAEKVFLLTTGGETVECAIKLARLRGRRIAPDKLGIVSFTGAFHGKTMGAQLAGGKPAGKAWIGHHDPDIHHIPFPFCQRCPWGRTGWDRCGAECFEKSMAQLAARGVRPDTIAAFLLEAYQGWGAMFYPDDYVHALRAFADRHDALVIFDEVQSGFGRTGTLFAFQQYGVRADLVCCGKGMGSGLPISAILGAADVLDADPSLNSTHSGNAVAGAAALATLEILEREDLAAIAAKTGRVVESALRQLAARHPRRVSHVLGRGLVWAVHLVDLETGELDAALGDRITEAAMRKGLLMVRTGAGTLKIGPPLSIAEEAVLEGIDVLDEAIAECTA
jgi:4-aminobutyrate aminotransferase / (S)-3-amino-2-methylpropionate transaminase / 5-aminovalerate transaminase